MGKSAIYFQFTNTTNTPTSLITNLERGRWGLEDIDIYVLAFYVNVIEIGTDTDGCRIKSVSPIDQ
jgi:hypothetical protein